MRLLMMSFWGLRMIKMCFRQNMLRCLVWLVLFSVYLVVLECNLANRGQKPQLLKEQLVKVRPRRALDRARQQTFSMVSLKDYVALLTKLFCFQSSVMRPVILIKAIAITPRWEWLNLYYWTISTSKPWNIYCSCCHRSRRREEQELHRKGTLQNHHLGVRQHQCYYNPSACF